MSNMYIKFENTDKENTTDSLKWKLNVKKFHNNPSKNTIQIETNDIEESAKILKEWKDQIYTIDKEGEPTYKNNQEYTLKRLFLFENENELDSFEKVCFKNRFTKPRNIEKIDPANFELKYNVEFE